MISAETCPFCHHGPHPSNQCKSSIDKLANRNNRCQCRIQWPMDELQALKNLEIYSRYRKEWEETLESANRDLYNAKVKMAFAQGEENFALRVLDKVREFIQQKGN